MAEPCQSYAHKYVGKGSERVLWEGQCALERGHDLDCLPIALAQQQAQNATWNAAVAATKTAIFDSLNDRLGKTDFWSKGASEVLSAVDEQITKELIR